MYKPIVLHGHERPITKIKYNRDCDLIFTCAKNSEANVWYSYNGERLGSYHGHSGVIWCLDVDWRTDALLTGSGDSSWRLWSVETGTCINSVETNNPVRSCGFSYCGNLFFVTTDEVIGRHCEVMVYDKRDDSHMLGKSNVFLQQLPEKEKITVAAFGPNDETIICGHENGSVTQLDATCGEFLKKTKPHSNMVTDIQMYPDLTMFATGSKDRTAKLIGSYDLDVFQTYLAERPINSAAISPTRNYVLIGGGQEAKEVTTTHTKEGGFDARIYHLFYGEEFARVKCHFGPINSVSFTIDGNGCVFYVKLSLLHIGNFLK
ncbi:unnamed protein product [Protopolystoma xenopodis]|uniref:Serine-threonine kinase receptor-associated protein n=1 Tax=Protopolystoma xenopodis TaxID=117903 RepID=A0A3S5A0C8_9PLAT|nr:unnamed protein product [Protopolystoma xenopodis]